MNKIILAHIALFAMNAIYGANHLLAKGVTPDYLGPNGFILLRGGITTVLFLIIFFGFIREKVDKKDLPRLAITGFFGVCMNQLFFFNGIALTSPMNVGIIMTSTPILVVILSYFILKEKITKLKALGVFVGAIGAIALTTIGQQPEFDSSLGDMYIFVNALSFGLYLVLVKPLMNKYKPMTVITYNFIFGFIFIMMYPPVWTDFAAADFSSFPLDIWLKTAYIIIGATFFTYLLNTFALKHVTPSVSGSYIYTQPVLVMFFTFLFAYIGWTEDFIGAISLEKILFMLMIFAGVFMISRSSYNLRRDQKERERKKA